MLLPPGLLAAQCWVHGRRLMLGCSFCSVTATLFERSRHACYVLLRGPQPGEEPGLVSLMKRKLKEDVSESRVIWLSQVAVDSEQYIRDRLYRMRFLSRV